MTGPLPRWRRRRNWGARITELTLAGLRAVALENELLRVTVLVDKGTDIVEFCDKRRDLDFVWLSPLGLRHPADVAGGAADDVGLFVDTYEGGWQEVFPSGGAPSSYRGAALAQHGEVAGLAWDYSIVADDETEVAVTFTVHARRLPFRLSKTLRLRSGEPTISFEHVAVNDSPTELHAMWGQHLAFGHPFLRPGCRIRLPSGISVIPHPEQLNAAGRAIAAGGPWAWPEVPSPAGDTVDLSVVGEPGDPSDVMYLTGFSDGWYELVDPVRAAGIRVSWDAQTLPYLWLWRELGASPDYPWWGRMYTMGLEPFSSYPTNGLADAVDNGSALTFAPGATKTLEWSATVIDN